MISFKWKFIHIVTQVLTVLVTACEVAPFTCSSFSWALSCSLCFSHTDLFSSGTKPDPTSGFSICCCSCLECSSLRIFHRWFLPVLEGSAHGLPPPHKLKILTLYCVIDLQECNSVYHRQKSPCLNSLLPGYSSLHQTPSADGKHHPGCSYSSSG